MSSTTDNTQAIHVGDPVTRETVTVHRGNTTIYFVKDDDEDTYTVLDEQDAPTGHTWVGDIDGIADFIALHDIFDDVERAA